MLNSLQGNVLRFKTIAFFLVFVLVFTIIMNSTSNIVAAINVAERGGIPVWLKNQIVGYVVGKGIDAILIGCASLSPVGQAALLTFVVIAGSTAIAFYMFNPDAVDYADYGNGCRLTYEGMYECIYFYDEKKLVTF